MLVYRDAGEEVDARAAWAALVRAVEALPPAPSCDATIDILIELGELEAAIADLLFAERDGVDALAQALRACSLAAGRLFLAARADTAAAAWRDALIKTLGRIDGDALPARVSRRVSEGYAYYALHPETYAAAANRFARAIGPAMAVCVGVRSIGTSLSAVVAAALDASAVPVRLWSVRPRGHPFDREVRLAESLRMALAADAASAHYLLVDEGPGISGSSLTAVAAALSALGIPDDRIVLFPGWDADGTTFNSEKARRRWQRHARWNVSAEAAGTGLVPLVADRSSIDWSAGAWRCHIYGNGGAWPAAHPQHERVKAFLPESRTIVKFAGLGRYGGLRRARAEVLADGGFGPPPGELRNGYLEMPFVAGAPLTRGSVPGVGDFLARYLAFIAARFGTSQPAPLDAVHHMIEVNCREADPSLPIPSLETFASPLRDRTATAIDGRMLAHEFVRHRGAIGKVDALDHSADHFFPGPQDVAWDLAAAEAELGIDDAMREQVLTRFAAAAGDRSITLRMPFYRLAYAAFQLGYARLAAVTLSGAADGQRFGARRVEFLARVRALLARRP
jgi:hypothetical protein